MTPLNQFLYISLLSLFSIISGGNQFSYLSDSTSPHFESNEVDQPPFLTNRDEIETLIGYPSVAWDARIEGKVILKVLVDENGYYLKHEVKDSFHPLLRIPCENYAQFLAFAPAHKNGEPVTCWLEVPFEFSIP